MKLYCWYFITYFLPIDHDELGNCNDVSFVANTREIDYKIKSYYNAGFCPDAFKMYMDNSQDIYNNSIHVDNNYRPSTNNRIHTAKNKCW